MRMRRRAVWILLRRLPVIPSTMDIGQEIRKRRQELRLTQQSLADISGVSVRMIKSIEGNYANPSIHTVEKLLKSLNLSLEIMETRQVLDA